jgi:LPS sulfotransferase NodH
VDLYDVKRAYNRLPSHPFYSGRPLITPRSKYMIAITPRSGSTMLAQELSRRYGLGHAGEFLNEGFIANFEHLFPTPSLSDFQRFLLTSFTSPEGIFGLKTDWFRYARARELEYLPRVYENIDLYIYMRRRDFVGQAVSLAVAMQTGIWHDTNFRFSRAEQVYANLVYDERMIADNVLSLMEQEYGWETYFQSVSARVIPIFYEDLAGALEDVLAEIGAALGAQPVGGLERGLAPALKPTPSRVNAAWRARFLESQAALVDHWEACRGRTSATS